MLTALQCQVTVLQTVEVQSGGHLFWTDISAYLGDSAGSLGESSKGPLHVLTHLLPSLCPLLPNCAGHQGPPPGQPSAPAHFCSLRQVTQALLRRSGCCSNDDKNNNNNSFGDKHCESIDAAEDDDDDSDVDDDDAWHMLGQPAQLAAKSAFCILATIQQAYCGSGLSIDRRHNDGTFCAFSRASGACFKCFQSQPAFTEQATLSPCIYMVL